MLQISRDQVKTIVPKTLFTLQHSKGKVWLFVFNPFLLSLGKEITWTTKENFHFEVAKKRNS